MEILINVLIIIFALIAILIFYFYTSRREQKSMGDKTPGINSGDMEASMETGISSGEIGKIKEMQKEKEKELNYRYNKTVIRLVTRDPNTIYAYWEVNQDIYYHNKPVLRIFCENDRTYFDLDINYNTVDWYINNLEPKRRYRAAIGYMREGKFHPLAFSRTVETPAGRPSDIIDERWMTIEELSRYTYLIDINSTLSLMKSLKKRREKEARNIDSFMFQRDERK